MHLHFSPNGRISVGMKLEELPKDPTVAAWVAIVRASNGIISAVAADAKAAGLPPLGWYDVLWELERSGKPGLRPFELENGLLLAQYNLSRLIDRMASAGYVEKRACPSDGRGQIIVLTEKGRALRKRIWPSYLAAIRKHVGSHLSEKDARALCSYLVRMIPEREAGTRANDAASCGE
jgi:DNA-binding MarR family transcriptional regulator